MISVQNVSKDYGSFRALYQVSFEVKRGEILGLLGPNGAGKTTIMRILTGFFPPTEGKVTLEGLDLFKEPTKLKRRIGYLPERVSIYPDLRVEEFLRFVAEIKGIPRKKIEAEIQEKMARSGLDPVRGRLIGHLSKGFLQRLGLAQALLGDPEVLILDEPTGGLDPKQIIEIRELIRELGRERTLVLSTHILPEASRVAERVLILNQGRIVAQGKPQELGQTLREQQEIIVRVGRLSPSVEESASREEVFFFKALHSIPGVASVEKIGQEDSSMTYLIRTSPDKELQSVIARRLVETGFPLLELTAKPLSLEEIFLKLVVSEPVLEEVP